MVQAIHRRLNPDEEGFTLIELMVVVLIIAILLAIAIPTFLGARGKAQNRAAQSNLRNALTAEKTVFTDASSYADPATVGPPTGLSVLQAAEPSTKWVTGGGGALVVGQVGVIATSDNLVLTALDASKTKCWYLVDEANAGAAVLPGTFYGFNVATLAAGVYTCTAMTKASGPLVAADAANGPGAVGLWGSTW